ncbi:allose kinase [Oscillospiraceae bacterium PP1C4]
MQDCVIGIDIGGTNFRIGMVSKQGVLANFQKESSSILTTGDAVQTLAEQITAYLDKFDAHDKVRAIAIGFPSIVSKDKKTLFSTPNLAGFDNINLKDPLEALLKLPVFIDRDVNFLMQNDIHQLGLDPSQTILGFYVGTGFGNAIYIEGRFYSGKNGVAGELGHIPLYGVEEYCTCGNIGCVETRCSGRYLEALVRENFPETQIYNVFAEHGDDPLVRRFVEDIAIPIAAEINILDPDVCVIAGGVVFMKGFPKDILEKAIRERVRKPYPAQNLELVFTEHTQQSGVLGSGEFAHQQLGNN